MSLSASLNRKVTAGSTQISVTISKTAGAKLEISETIAADAEDYEIVFPLDVSECVLFFMTAGSNLTIETNSGGTPVETLSLVGDEEYDWHDTDLHAFLLTEDVTSLFVTNTGGTATTLQIVALSDPTP